ncbi:uncharacterized protein LOC119324401 [Triticum dicoccoides]|uniref:uncharacterized protein LOC119324401 n=1 Tax=Triticum dicoccoides TaxID=85692 RepID=UPI001891D492|nr:uncharacterized protein LOC119324401 [Triticum dicoccoides]
MDGDGALAHIFPSSTHPMDGMGMGMGRIDLFRRRRRRIRTQLRRVLHQEHEPVTLLSAGRGRWGSSPLDDGEVGDLGLPSRRRDPICSICANIHDHGNGKETTAAAQDGVEGGPAQGKNLEFIRLAEVVRLGG